VNRSSVVGNGDFKTVEFVRLTPERPIRSTVEREPVAPIILREGRHFPDASTTLINEPLTEYRIRPGDLLLLESEPDTVDRLADDPNVIVAGELAIQQFRSSKLPIAVGIVLSVVGVAAFGILPVMVAAPGGVMVMIVTGIVKPAEAYEAVQWNVIFLLAGVIPLGTALSETGGADLLGTLVVSTADFLPSIAVLGLFYLLTVTMTNFISNQASVVLLIPVAVDTAARLNANAFAFVLGVTFAASAAFMSPVGYQTNLFVYVQVGTSSVTTPGSAGHCR